jgi:hypothetical protein
VQLGAATPEVGGSPVVERDAACGVGRVDGRGQRLEQLAEEPLALAQRLLRPFALGDVLKAVHAADDLAVGAEERIEVGEDGDARTIGTLDDDLPVADRLARAQQLGHRRLGQGQRLAVGSVRLVSPAEPELRVT